MYNPNDPNDPIAKSLPHIGAIGKEAFAEMYDRAKARRESAERAEKEAKDRDEWYVREAKERDERYVREAKERAEREAYWRAAENRKIMLGKIFAMLFQIGAIIAYIISWDAIDFCDIQGTVALVIATAAFFCRIFFTEEGKGLVSMIFIIVLSVIWFIISVVSGMFEDRWRSITLTSEICVFVYGIGNIVAAILAYRNKN